jgi:hypothetical protein
MIQVLVCSDRNSESPFVVLNQLDHNDSIQRYSTGEGTLSGTKQRSMSTMPPNTNFAGRCHSDARLGVYCCIDYALYHRQVCRPLLLHSALQNI